MPPRRLALALLLIFAAVTLAYANHFNNGFHFDDFHTVSNNPSIRSLHNPARFFTDPSTFSVLRNNSTYRPLVTLSLAFDYWLGGGLNPFYFHLDTFIWFLTQLTLMFFLFRAVIPQAMARKMPNLKAPVPSERWSGEIAALFAVALYGLHPVIAETVNYIVQRGDLDSTMLLVASLTLYVLHPGLRKYGVYLLPLALALLVKQPAAIFPALLFAYLLLYETPSPRDALIACLPSLAVTAVMLWLQVHMIPATFSPGSMSRSAYIITQPWVALHYFLMFLAPVALSADTDQTALATLFSAEGIAGLAFLAALVYAIWRAARAPRLRAAAFGLAWFLLALLPTSLYRLGEVENDHRMYLPFVGLALAAGNVAVLLVRRQAPARIPLAAAAAVILAACGYGTVQRNQVWRSEESLWRDVALKSPRNGRGLMNYGHALMVKGNYTEALSYFQRALEFSPDYYLLELNLGVITGELGRDAEAEGHFHRAALLEPNDEQPLFYYGRWLMKRGRVAQAIRDFQISIARNPAYLDPRYALMQAYWDVGKQDLAKSLAAETLQIVPGDAIALRFYRGQAVVDELPNPVAAAEAAVRRAPAPENYLDLSKAYHQALRYEDCIRAAKEAIKLRPDYAEAYNNIASAHADLQQWDEAIAAATEAVRLKPDFALAKNNLAYSLQQKKLAAK
jgi:tetratricopeptide (TPR) repeat protein